MRKRVVKLDMDNILNGLFAIDRQKELFLYNLQAIGKFGMKIT